MKAIAVILAGGMSRRMGQDKANLPIGGETMLTRLVHNYRPWFDGVWVSMNESGRFDTAGAGELVDHRPGGGPLAGLESAFLDTDADVVFLTATDLPFSDPALASEMVKLCVGWDACLLTDQEPLFGAYSRACLPVIQSLLDREERRMRGLLDRVSVHYLGETEASRARLLNVNHPETYERALEYTSWL